MTKPNDSKLFNTNEQAKRALNKLQELSLENMNNANKSLLLDKQKEFEKYQLIYQTIQDCIDIVNTELKM